MEVWLSWKTLNTSRILTEGLKPPDPGAGEGEGGRFWTPNRGRLLLLA